MIDPEQAQVAVDRALASHEVLFCQKPPVPLMGHARDLCPHASAIPNCEALVRACGGEVPADNQLPLWLSSIATLVMYGLFAIFIVVIAIGIYALVRTARKDAPAPAEVEEEKAKPAETSNDSPQGLMARADALRTTDPEQALALYLRASLVALDVRGALHVTDDRTNGEHLRALREEKSRAPLRAIVNDVERVRFGRAAPDTTIVERVAKAAAMIALSAMLSSCNLADRAGLGPAADPAALTMFTQTLAAQGVEIRGSGSLARLPLPLPTETEIPPALLVDLDIVEMEAETTSHLRAWMEAGGTLVVVGEGAPSFAETSRTLATTTEVRTPTIQDHAIIRTPEGLTQRLGCTVAAYAGQTPFALVCPEGRGVLLAMATDDLVANAGFVRGHNAKVSVALFATLAPTKLLVAGPADGALPPDSPVASLLRAGLGPGLLHGLATALMLFWAIGMRLARPKPADPPARRAFTEHVEATGALHARRGTAKHALASYVRFTEGVHARGAISPPSKGERTRGDVPLSISHRTGVNVDQCEAIWTRARNPAPGEELEALRALHRLLSRSSSPR